MAEEIHTVFADITRSIIEHHIPNQSPRGFIRELNRQYGLYRGRDYCPETGHYWAHGKRKPEYSDLRDIYDHSTGFIREWALRCLKAERPEAWG
jgi:hypothetical protein